MENRSKRSCERRAIGVRGSMRCVFAAACAATIPFLARGWESRSSGAQPSVLAVTDGNGDLSTSIAACVERLPTGGGTCDARAAPDTEFRRELVIRKAHVTILLGPGTFRLTKAAALRFLANEGTLVGHGPRATVLSVEGPTGISVGDAETVVRGWRVERLSIVSDGKLTSTGVLLRNAREGVMQDVWISQFRSGGTALSVGDDCWSNVADRAWLFKNSVGVGFVGREANAWVFRSCAFNQNVVGVLFDLGAAAGQGIGFTDGTHFEGNESVGILLRSGILQDIYASDVYVEAFPGQRFVVAAPRPDRTLRVLPLRMSGGFVFTADQPPVWIFTRTGSDRVVVLVDALHVRSSAPILPMVVTSGPGASASVQAATRLDAGGRDAGPESSAGIACRPPPAGVALTVPARVTPRDRGCTSSDVLVGVRPSEVLVADGEDGDAGLVAASRADGLRVQMRDCRADRRGAARIRRFATSGCSSSLILDVTPPAP